MGRTCVCVGAGEGRSGIWRTVCHMPAQTCQCERGDCFSESCPMSLNGQGVKRRRRCEVVSGVSMHCGVNVCVCVVH